MSDNDASSNRTGPKLDRRTVLSMGVGGAVGILGLNVASEPAAAWHRFDVDFRGLDEVWFVVGNDLKYDPPAVAHVIVWDSGEVTCQLVEFTEANATTVPETYGDSPVVKYKADSGWVVGILAYNRAVDSDDRFSRPRCVMQNDNLWIRTATLQEADCVSAAVANHWDGEYRPSWWDPLKPSEEPTTPEAVFGPDEPVEGQQFGATLAVDDTGDTLVVGAPGDGESGAVYVFERGDQWTRQAKFTPDDTDHTFGRAMDVTAAGDTIVVGAPPRKRLSNPGGSVYVYTTDGDGWELSERLQGGDEPGMEFGRSVAIDGPGNRLLVGTPMTNGGRGYVFDSDPWEQTGELLIPEDYEPSETPRAVYWGRTVALSDDGSTALLGHPTGGMGFGEAHVFTRNDDKWTHHRILEKGAEDYYVGHSLALDAAGEVALIGTNYDIDEGPFRAGYVAVASEIESPWTTVEKTTVVPENGDPLDRFGRAVAIDDAGETILVGSPFRDTASGSDAGVAFLYDNNADGVAYRKMIVSDAGEAAHFGDAVGVNATGTLAVVGAPDATISGVRSGTVSIFDIDQNAENTIAQQRYGRFRRTLFSDFSRWSTPDYRL
ncbi:MAG: hypothetical protein ACQEQJ_00415 [Halobacteriota archaeon]